MFVSLATGAAGLGAAAITALPAAYLPAGALALASIQASPSPERNILFEYDALGRLVAVNKTTNGQPQTQVTYAYDPAGNRTQQITTGATPAMSGRVVVLPLAGFTIIPLDP